MADGGDRRMIPKDMKGLLRISSEIADPSNANKTSEEVITQMDPERKEFLEKALSELNTDPVQRMKACIHVIKNTDDSEDGVDTKLSALEEILDWCGQIDFAIDFHKIGGFEILPQLLNHEESELRWNCLEVIAEIVQNNPYCQKAVLEHGLMPVLLKMLDTDSNNTVKTKALYALSCLARDDPDSQKKFVELNGFSYLMRAMQTNVEKLQVKASFMLRGMCTSNPEFKDTLCDIGMVEQLIGLVQQDHNQQHEHMMNALLLLVTNHQRAKQIAQKSEFKLIDFLQQRIEFLKGKEEFLEESEYAQQILSIMKQEEDTSTAIR
ncbi:hypothetical protein LOTGIDRAFT_181506 [Lottia gigantea]|uniref:Nucleotide exchange factor Fes1 domain-containing protein n=1 Tax=Lottia gigantea TaxID=225164 RepID=V4AK82_LOTGI|nr:hypothetical protein LOTGIDRAFT_181506 [Lottia gigantea]ESO97507.1 hypothetical protein LOTGIDRAFT_181506 [Lottia gigantea]